MSNLSFSKDLLSSIYIFIFLIFFTIASYISYFVSGYSLLSICILSAVIVKRFGCLWQNVSFPVVDFYDFVAYVSYTGN